MKLNQLILTSLAVMGSYQMQAQDNIESKTHIIEADFNNDNHIDKMEIILNNQEANVFYHQNNGNNTYLKPTHLDTIQYKNNIAYFVSYSKEKERNVLIIGPSSGEGDQEGLNFNDGVELSIRNIKKIK